MWRVAGSTGSVGIEVAVAIAIGYFAGHYLDKKLGTAPWIMYVGLLAGIGAAVKALVRVVRAYRREDTAAGSKGGGGEGPSSGAN